MGKKRGGPVAGGERAQILLDSEWAVLRDVEFPLGELIDQGAVQVAKMLGVPFEELEASRAADDIPEWVIHPDGTVETRPAPVRQGPEQRTKERAMANVSEKVVAEGWDDIDVGTSGAGAFIKWQAGDERLVNVWGVPRQVEKDWNDGKGPKMRVYVDVYVAGDGVKTWDMAPATYGVIKKEMKEFGSQFRDALFKVNCEGSMQQKRLTVSYRRQLKPEEAAKRDEAVAAAGAQAATATRTGGDSDIPF